MNTKLTVTFSGSTRAFSSYALEGELQQTCIQDMDTHAYPFFWQACQVCEHRQEVHELGKMYIVQVRQPRAWKRKTITLKNRVDPLKGQWQFFFS